MTAIGVIGAGSWGVALAQLCASAGEDTIIWSRRGEAAAEINETRRSAYLPDITLHYGIKASDDLSVLKRSDILLCVVPVQGMRQTLSDLAAHIPSDAPLVLCSKGVERESCALPTEIAGAVTDNPLAVLSGPSFAADVVSGKPTAVTIAADRLEMATVLQQHLGTQGFRLYASDDPTGAQTGGAIKNVLAIACGIVVARDLGESARAALVARGFAEMTRLALALGGRRKTLAGLSGMGDLVLTCGSDRSRNFAAGLRLGDPGRATTALGVSEGTHTAAAAVALARKHGVEMPICETVHGILAGDISVSEGIERLLNRPMIAET